MPRGIALIAFVSLTVLAVACPGVVFAQQQGLSVRAAPSGPDKTTISKAFVDIPDMVSGIVTTENGSLEITFTGEASTSGGEKMFVRALVDGKPAQPSDVLFVDEGYTGIRSFTFIKENLGAGNHVVQVQWSTDGGGTVSIGDRTLTLYASPELTKSGGLVVKAAPSGPDKKTSSGAWSNVPHMFGGIATAANSNLQITFSGEASTSGGATMFIRALVDGKPAEPSDVFFVDEGFTGTRSFTLIKEKLSAGNHVVQVQWSTDGGGTASIGDRTLTLYASPELTKSGGLVVKAAPSGPDKKATSTNWIDIPDMKSTIVTAANSHLKITFSGEAGTSGGEKMFVRALVDGKAAEPSDVLFVKEAFSGTRSLTFVKENLSAGNHVVQVQWSTDGGGTASIGDRTLSLSSHRAQVPDLSKPFYSLKPVIGKRKVLAILWDPHRAQHPAPTRKAVEDLIFGPKPSVRDYWLENSGGRFTIESCGVLGWFDANHPSVHYWGTAPRIFDQEDLFEDRNGNGILDPGEDLNNNGTLDGPDGILQPDEDLNANGSLDYDLNNDGWIHGHVEKWAEAIGKADQQFDFKKYDIDNDKNLSPEELTILVVIPQNDAFGTQRTAVGKEWPKKEPLTADGVEIHTLIEAYIGSPPSLGLVAHELAHILLGAGDMYFPGFFPYAAGPYSLMDQAPENPPHLDPFHKLRLGWVVPKVITSSGWHEIPDVETHHEVFILHDPARGGKEYYMLENRWPGNSYDSYLPDSGLAIWHIIEDKSIFSTLPAPAGVSAGLWAGVYPHEWARRGIRLVRPIYGPPINFGRALWEGSIPQTSYDLLSVDPNPNHATLKWAEDGSPSGFSIQSIPVSGPKMNVYIGK